MEANLKFSHLASTESLERAVKALSKNGFTTFVMENAAESKTKVLELVPQGAEVMTMTSRTLDTIGVSQEVNDSGNYEAVRPKLMGLPEDQKRERRKLAAAPDWVIGSVHAVTEDGHLMIASRTGSQLGPEAYGAEKVIFVVGTQKIVKDNEEGFKRIYEYSLPLEDKRAQEAYGVGSEVDKILLINKEMAPDRVTVILVKENLGF